MAKIKFGMMMTDARGKLGGQVFSKNRSGAYVRTKVTPVNPRTTYQMASRFILGTLSSSWSGLTPAQRRSWNEAVEDWKKTDVFGDLRNPTGKNLFTALNKNLVQSGQAQINTPPAKVVLPELAIAGIVFAGQDVEIATTGDLTGFTVQMWLTKPLTAGTEFIDDKLRAVAYHPGGQSLAYPFDFVIDDRMGTYTAGDKVGVGIRVIAPNGQASVRLQEVGIL